MSNRGSRHGIYLRGSHWYARAALRSPKYIMNLCMSVHRAIISARWKTSLSNPFCLSEKMYERPPPSWSPIPVLIALTLPTAKPHPLEPLSNSTPPPPSFSLFLILLLFLLFSELRLAGARWCADVYSIPSNDVSAEGTFRSLCSLKSYQPNLATLIFKEPSCFI